ncbi:hypothetical protein [Halosolutus gelatinilyticus]|uniref:hypothetical protein n=1 Tax=Halosolutus gelatinilyticus TaxID=2931975 RepID=UPI001FF12EB1|nr:hypothetical protein [Halosolutus gelatinilyticus]
MALLDSAVVFVLSLLIGTIAILAGVRLILDTDAGVANAALTALIGAIVWAVVSYFVGWIPLLGILLMLLAWIGVINWRYPGGWGTAAAIGFVAWIVAIAIAYALAMVGIVAPEAIGIPGV